VKKYAPTHESSLDGKLGYFIEECGEALQAAGKSLRWGLDSVNPELPQEQQETNLDWLLREMVDVQYAITLLQRHFNQQPDHAGDTQL
jgi:NTP pyrophosphatase (non-canonical NTP hydrolase)